MQNVTHVDRCTSCSYKFSQIIMGMRPLRPTYDDGQQLFRCRRDAAAGSACPPRDPPVLCNPASVMHQMCKCGASRRWHLLTDVLDTIKRCRGCLRTVRSAPHNSRSFSTFPKYVNFCSSLVCQHITWKDAFVKYIIF